MLQKRFRKGFLTKVILSSPRANTAQTHFLPNIILKKAYCLWKLLPYFPNTFVPVCPLFQKKTPPLRAVGIRCGLDPIEKDLQRLAGAGILPVRKGGGRVVSAV